MLRGGARGPGVGLRDHAGRRAGEHRGNHEITAGMAAGRQGVRDERGVSGVQHGCTPFLGSPAACLTRLLSAHRTDCLRSCDVENNYITQAQLCQ